MELKKRDGFFALLRMTDTESGIIGTGNGGQIARAAGSEP